MRYQWPGNVRELENIVERAILSVQDFSRAQSIDAQQLRYLIPEIFDNDSVEDDEQVVAPTQPNLRAVVRASEVEHVREVLSRHGGNKNQAAQALGISRSTLWRRLNAN